MFEFIAVVKLSGGTRLYEILATDRQKAKEKIKNEMPFLTVEAVFFKSEIIKI